MTVFPLGIDVSKDTLDIALILTKTGEVIQTQVANSEKGCAQLMKWVRANQVSHVHACLEATGTYSNLVAKYLYNKQQLVSVINPIQAKRFSEMTIRRASTDRSDAVVLANFCATYKPMLWKPMSPQLQLLKQFFSARKGLVAQKIQQTNRLKAPDLHPEVQKLYKRLIKTIDKEVAAIEVKMKALVKAYPDLFQNAQLITSIPGIGEITAIGLIAEIGDVRRFKDCKHLVSFSGLSPAFKISGTSVNRKLPMSSFGKKSMRTMMFMPALSAKQHNPIIIQMAQRMEAAGKPTMIIIGAIMRKLIRLVYGVLKSQQPFDPHWVSKDAISI